jgi:uncharacterized protein YerC
MPHVSKKKLKSEHFNKLYGELIRSFERSFKNRRTKQVLGEFFTETEKIMFSKRLAVIALLSREASIPTIFEALAMSPSTIEKMSLKYEHGNYDQTIKSALGKKDIWNILELIFTAGGIMPPIVGKNRWKNINKLIHDEGLMKS